MAPREMYRPSWEKNVSYLLSNPNLLPVRKTLQLKGKRTPGDSSTCGAWWWSWWSPWPWSDAYDRVACRGAIAAGRALRATQAALCLTASILKSGRFALSIGSSSLQADCSRCDDAGRPKASLPQSPAAESAGLGCVWLVRAPTVPATRAGQFGQPCPLPSCLFEGLNGRRCGMRICPF